MAYANSLAMHMIWRNNLKSALKFMTCNGLRKDEMVPKNYVTLYSFFPQLKTYGAIHNDENKGNSDLCFELGTSSN